LAKFDLNAYGLAMMALEKLVAEGHSEIAIDCSHVERAFPDGMVPLIARLMRIRDTHGTLFVIIPPKTTGVAGLFEGMGWSHYLESRDAAFVDLPKHMPQFTPIRPFWREHLAACHGALLDVLVSQQRLAAQVPEAINWAIWEVMDNVLNHAEVDYGWVQVSTFREKKHINILVVDAGVGIRASLGTRYPNLSEQESIRRAIERGETRDPQNFFGYGLHGCREIAIQTGGQMILVSGGTKFVQSSRQRSAKGLPKAGPPRSYLPFTAPHAGTVVELVLRADRPVDMGQVLGHSQPISVLEETRGSGDDFVFLVKREAMDLGTRDAGRRLRNKVVNLSQAEREGILVLDFSGVEMVSSSFADEFVAKLARSVGPDVWRAQFELRNVAPAVNTVIQIALWHRDSG
jgi:anti-sigma regulatory factor (Ser/Thr protein kinase)/anti-anti-sigma regulatory factor